MKKLAFLLMGTFLIAHYSFAQFEDGEIWHKGGNGAVNFTQSSFVNWTAGGENNFAGAAYLGLFANRKKGKWSWDNSANFAYGFIKQKSTGFRKSEDRIELNSKAGYAIAEKWYISLPVNFRTQFSNGYIYPDIFDPITGEQLDAKISGFMTPGYLSIGLGADYKPCEDFSLYMSPLTARWTFVLDDSIANLGTYGNDPAKFDALGMMIEPGKNIRTEAGAQIRAEYKKAFAETMNFATSLTLFSNYLENPQYVDVYWTGIYTAQVWKMISVSLSLDMMYDYDILIPKYNDGVETAERGMQFKQVLGIGLSYNFGWTAPAE